MPLWPPLPPQPVVTIVTPSFNSGRFIEATIRSVLEQDYPAIEYLVMDGSSTDGTLDVLRRYGDRLRWRSGRDGGQSAAINAGWRAGRGEVLAWLNADDTYLPGAVGSAVAYLQAYPAAAAVYGDCDITDEHGRALRPYHTGPFDLVTMVRKAQNPVPQPAVFMRRAALEAAGYLDERLHMAMDLELWLRLGLRYEVGYLPHRLATLREHPETKTLAHLERFGPELLAIYEWLFAQPGLPPALRACHDEAMGAALLRAANNFYIAGLLKPARRYLLASWRRAPGRLNHTALKLLLLGPLGRPGWWAFTRGRQGLLRAVGRVRAASPGRQV
jgi:glycosyltransferase involved in cell wall biosynthesis